jgi:hypothetical protein
MECVIVRQAGRALTVRQILMNVLMLISVRTTLNVRILVDLTSVCVMMDTSVLEMFVLVSQIILMDLSFRFRFMVFNTTFNNISVILWRSILLMEKNRVPGENHRPVTDKLYHKCCIEYTLQWTRFELTTLVVIGTDCTGSCKSNYHTITTTTAPFLMGMCLYLRL